MSIRGVDGQLMIARTPDFMKDASEQLKAGERMQNFAAAQTQAETELEQRTVVGTDKTPEPELHLENEGGGGAGGHSGSKKKKGEAEAQELSLLDANVGLSSSTIDIKL